MFCKILQDSEKIRRNGHEISQKVPLVVKFERLALNLPKIIAKCEIVYHYSCRTRITLRMRIYLRISVLIQPKEDLQKVKKNWPHCTAPMVVSARGQRRGSWLVVRLEAHRRGRVGPHDRPPKLSATASDPKKQRRRRLSTTKRLLAHVTAQQSAKYRTTYFCASHHENSSNHV